MCLLIVLHRVHPESPLIVAANRDELLARPATAMTVLQASEPRILGGRDEAAGGTWLAVNEHGLFAALTNVPAPGGRDPAKRSRGELPLALARHPNAEEAVSAFIREFRPADFNPAWILAGDRRALFYVDFSGEAPRAEPLAPGLHILENQPLAADSPKADLVREKLSGVLSARGDALRFLLLEVLRSHEVPPRAQTGNWKTRPPQTQAACVHAGLYGTRSSTLLLVPPEAAPPRLWCSDGPPCVSPIREATRLWAR